MHIITETGSNAAESEDSEGETKYVKTEPINHSSNAVEAQQKVDEKVLSVLKGDLSNYAIFKAKIVRIFISSTFTGK